jgi:hypothetical protein
MISSSYTYPLAGGIGAIQGADNFLLPWPQHEIGAGGGSAGDLQPADKLNHALRRGFAQYGPRQRLFPLRWCGFLLFPYGRAPGPRKPIDGLSRYITNRPEASKATVPGSGISTGVNK